VGEMVLLQDVTSSNSSQVRFKLCLPVNLRPRPFSPSRKSVSLSISILMMYIFPVVLSLNLSPIFIIAPSPFLTSWRAQRFEAKNYLANSGTIRIAFFSGSARSSFMILRQCGHCINSLVSRPILFSLNFFSQCGHKASNSNMGFPFFKI
jgi:hypothetical protein